MDGGYNLALQENERINKGKKLGKLLESQGIEVQYDETGMVIFSDPEADGFSERGTYEQFKEHCENAMQSGVYEISLGSLILVILLVMLVWNVVM